ncbi:MAG: YggS family pyridoxal phosphate-dependent enzyme [Oscillospiraceae bacterium]|nr:YggS family pyridoxal phosphate-dependent enzyme [Oscillospiraceae bacterium]
MSIAENIAAVRENIARAALEAGRRPEEIMLVGASKMNDAAACREAIAAGIDALGENRVQEMTQKLAENAYDGAPLHFIGHLQRNKVNKVVGSAALIESAGSNELLRAIDAQAGKLGIVQEVLLEVNIGGEDAKSGFSPLLLPEAAEYALSLGNIRVRGLMCIPPVADGPHGSIPYFEKVRLLYVDINEKMYHNKLDMLSMGMSGDYEDAVRTGATVVRVGTAIFGRRNYGAPTHSIPE